MEPKPRFLNPEVQAQVQKSFILFIAWGLTHGTYDWEIDPLHRPEWVREQQAKEASDLEALKVKIAALLAERGVPTEE